MAIEPATFERRDGPTPNGGAYSTAQFSKGDGTTWETCSKEVATRVEITEYTADNQAIMRTYGIIRPS